MCFSEEAKISAHSMFPYAIYHNVVAMIVTTNISITALGSKAPGRTREVNVKRFTGITKAQEVCGDCALLVLLCVQGCVLHRVLISNASQYNVQLRCGAVLNPVMR